MLVKGIIIGFSIAAPVGPIGVLCIRRTLAHGRAHGFVSGLGAASADAIYGSIAAFGLTSVANILVGQQMWLRLVGGAFLLYLGIRTLLARPATEAAQARESASLPGAYLSTFVLTLTNPLTILSFAAVFAGLGAGVGGGDALAVGTLVGGVFAGSALWWLLLSGGVGLFGGWLRRRGTTPDQEGIPPALLVWINRVSGLIIVGFGLWALIGLLAGGGR